MVSGVAPIHFPASQLDQGPAGKTRRQAFHHGELDGAVITREGPSSHPAYLADGAQQLARRISQTGYPTLATTPHHLRIPAKRSRYAKCGVSTEVIAKNSRSL